MTANQSHRKRDVARSESGRSKAEPARDTPATADHDQWLLDEALRETFPASDPISPATEDDRRPLGSQK